MSGNLKAVLLWADDLDDRWVSQRVEHSKRLSKQHHEAPCRYRNWGFIDLCLSSLLVNAPWLAEIILITPNHVPANLSKIQAINERIPINIIPEESVVPKCYLPCFNVFALETFLHTLPSLTEKFLYINDDMFLLNPCTAEQFISDSGQIVVSKHSASDIVRPQPASKSVMKHVEYMLFGASGDDGSEQWQSMVRRTAQLYMDEYQSRDFIYDPHFPSVYSKTALRLMSDQFSDEIETTRMNKFRGPDDIHILSLAVNHLKNDGQIEVKPRDECFVPILPNARALKQSLSEALNHSIVCVNDSISGNGPVPEPVSAAVTEFVHSAFRKLDLHETILQYDG